MDQDLIVVDAPHGAMIGALSQSTINEVNKMIQDPRTINLSLASYQHQEEKLHEILKDNESVSFSETHAIIPVSNDDEE